MSGRGLPMKEREPRYDEAEVEITDLDAGKADEHESTRAQPPVRFDSQSRAWARQHRRPLTAASAVLVALAVLLILASSASIRGLVGGLLARHNPTPTPARTLIPGGDLFYVDAAPPWGHLWIDGRAIARLPDQGVEAPLRLSPGRHTLTWRAAPFEDQQCALTVPSNYVFDTCMVNEGAYPYAPQGFSISSITFEETLNTLPPNLSAALVSTAQAALDAQRSLDLVRSGELYALAPDNASCKPGISEPLCYTVAAQPLQAVLSYRLDTNPSSNENCLDPEPNCTLQYQSCYVFCTGGFALTGEWNVFVPVLPLWTFTTSSGAVVERDIPDNSLADFATGQMTDEVLMPLLIAWDGTAWRAFVPAKTTAQDNGIINTPACAAAVFNLQSLKPPVDASDQVVYLQWQFASGANAAAGCVGVGSPTSLQPAAATPGTIPAPYAMFRFGVILAANDVAHQFWPRLPLADVYERQLAQQLLALPGNPQP
jgi:hypothetical protein